MHTLLQKISLSREINYKLLYVLLWPLESVKSTRHYIQPIIKIFALSSQYITDHKDNIYIIYTCYIILISTEFRIEYLKETPLNLGKGFF